MPPPKENCQGDFCKNKANLKYVKITGKVRRTYWYCLFCYKQQVLDKPHPRMKVRM